MYIMLNKRYELTQMGQKVPFYPILSDKGYESDHSMTKDSKQDFCSLILWNSNNRPSYVSLVAFIQLGQYLPHHPLTCFCGNLLFTTEA